MKELVSFSTACPPPRKTYCMLSLAFRLVKPSSPAALRNNTDLRHQVPGNGMESGRGCLEGNRTLILGWPLKFYQAHSHALWEVPALGLALLWGLCRAARSLGPLAALGRMGAACNWVSLCLSLSFPTWGDRFPFSLVKVALSLATGRINFR